MAFVVNSITQDADTTATYTQKIPLGHAANDILLATVINNSAAGSAMTASGWTSIGATTTVSSASRSQVFWKLASSSSEADLSVSGQSAIWSGNITVIRGADTSNPIDVITNGDQTVNAASFTGATTTTSTNNCLVLHAYAMRTSARMILTDPAALTFVSKGVSGFGTTSMYVGYRVQETAGATTASSVYYNLTSSNTGRMFVIAIKDANPSSPTLPPDSRNTYEVVKLHYGITGAAGGIDSFSRNETTTWVDVGGGGIAASTINGLSIVTSASTTVAGYAAPDRPTATSGIIINTSAVDATGRLMGVYHTLSSYDFSGKVISLSWGTTTTNLLGNEGFIVYFEDGSNNWEAFQLSGRIGIFPNNTYTSFIAPGYATPYGSSGTIDWTDIAKVGYMVHRVTSATTSRTWYVNMLTTLTNTIAYGGSSTVPINASFFGTILGDGNGAYGLIDFSGSGQIVTRGSIQIGDSSKTNYVSLPANSIEQPQLPDGKFRNQFWQGGANAITTKYSFSSSDTVSIARSALSSPIQQNLAVAGSTPATFTSSGATYIKQSGELISGATYTRTTFDQCGEINLNTAILDTCSVSNSTAAVAIVTNDPSDISNTAFTSAGTGHAIKITATGTFAFEGNTFSGYGADGTTDASIFNDSGGAVTLTLAAGDATPTVKNGTGASTTITGPTNNQSVTISGATAGSRIQIYDLTSSTELYNGTPTFPYTWTDASPYAADREIRLRVAYVNGTSAKKYISTTIGTATETDYALSYQVNQEDDDTYNTNAIDGSTITGITINDGTSQHELNKSGGTLTLQDWYAYSMYYRFTSTGIAGGLLALTASDTANYTLTGKTIKNTTSPSVPLKITGGWITDGDTGNPMDIADTSGGNIFLVPPHVVAFETLGSPVITGDIADVPTVADVWSYTLSNSKTAAQNVVDIDDNADTAANK